MKLSNLATNSDVDLCPDGWCIRTRTYVESKSCGRGGRFLVERGQLENYLQAQEQESCKAVYTLWSYVHPLPVGSKKPRKTSHVPDDVHDGSIVSFVVAPARWVLDRLGDTPRFEPMDRIDLPVALYVGPYPLRRLALKSEETPIARLRQIRSFIEADR